MIKNILFVDDDEVARLIIKTNLELQGYLVAVAENGLDAMRVLEQQPVDLVITDVVMPEMDGVDLYQALKTNPRTADLPIMIVTDQTVFIESFSALGVDWFVTKSSPISVFIDKIRKIEERGQKRGALSKVVVGAMERWTADQMATTLRQKGCLVSVAISCVDIISKAFVMVPDVIFIDISMKDHASTRELIRCLRCLDFLRKCRIVVFSDFAADQPSGDAQTVNGPAAEIETAMLLSGADKYLGRFSRATFADQLGSLGII
jgi:CheY-like chemotaxis protein